MTKLSAKEIYKLWSESILVFIEDIWGLVPQKKNEVFDKGKHITWQQVELLRAIDGAMAGKSSRRISVRSGHGVGKSCVLAWVVLWFLFTRPHAQVPCTAPTSDQIFDVLWKEIAKWLKKMPEGIAKQYDWTGSYIRMTESPETWFARAKTARKEAPEALAGIHADNVMFIVDESSGVHEEIFNVAEGALTDENILVLLISNPTRLVGYFYDTHHRDKEAWNCLHFNSKESPIVDDSYVQRIAKKHGVDSDEYRVRVLGDFPKADAVDGKGYVQLIREEDLKYTVDAEFKKGTRLGVDPAGEGKDKSAFVVRDAFKARIVAKEKTSTAKSVAQKTVSLMEMYNINDEDVTVDSFGVGANVIQELALAGHKVNGVNVGEKATKKKYTNLRAEAYLNLKEWLRTGGELNSHKSWKELLVMRYRATLTNKIQIMGKADMKRLGHSSPDFFASSTPGKKAIDPTLGVKASDYASYEQAARRDFLDSDLNK